MQLPRFARSASTRIVGSFLIIQAVSLGLAILLLNNFTQSTITADARLFIDELRTDLVSDYHSGGVADVVATMRERIGQPDYRDAVIALRDRHGTVVAGNVSPWPAGLGDHDAAREILLPHAGSAGEEVLASTTPLGDGTLLVGRRLGSEAQLARAAGRAFAIAFVVGLALTAISTWLFSIYLRRRVGAFASVAETVQRGDLSRRVPDQGANDVFDRLGAAINVMLERIERLVGELRLVTDSMAHDLRSPVARLKSTLERTLVDTRGTPAHGAVGAAIDEADSLERMLTTALQISRAEAGLGRDQFVQVSLRDLLTDVAEIYGPIAEEAGFEVAVDAPEAAVITGHRDLLFQAVTNLVDNALKYAVGGSRIDLRVHSDGLHALMSVGDDGPGIAPERRAEAQRRFARLDPSRSATGAGLGLSLVQTIATLHGGTMSMQAGPTGGLVVKLNLPVT